MQKESALLHTRADTGQGYWEEADLKLAAAVVLLAQAALGIVQVRGEDLLVVLQLLRSFLGSACLGLRMVCTLQRQLGCPVTTPRPSLLYIWSQLGLSKGASQAGSGVESSSFGAANWLDSTTAATLACQLEVVLM